MAEILSLRGILDICARDNGKTTSIIEECKDYILVGNATLIVVSHNSESVKQLTRDITDLIRHCGFYDRLIITQIGYLKSDNASIRIMSFDSYTSEFTFRGYKMDVDDVLFDCPEKVFDNRIVNLPWMFLNK